MMLSDTTIRERLEKDGDLAIYPSDIESQLQPSSFDVRLGREFCKLRHPLSEKGVPLPLEEVPPLDPSSGKAVEYDEVTVGDEGYVLDPLEFVLGTTAETVEIPRDVGAKVEGRSSFGRIGVTIHITAGFVDPGFQGQITLEIFNVSSMPIRLRPGVRIGQLVMYELDKSCETPYGQKGDSKYMGQRGPVGSRADMDHDLTD